MEQDRNEVYERIPWEHLDSRAKDRQWLYVGMAGVVALGVLAYTFVRNQPTEPEIVSPPVASVPPSTVPGTSAPPPTTASPIVVAEADLFAVDPARLAALAAAHAEWFAVEYFSVDGSVASAETLRGLLPEGVPLPEAPEGTQVFVDWVGTREVTETDSFQYDVDVLVRSLVSTGDTGFVRQPIRMIRVPVGMSGDGVPRLLAPPRMLEIPSPGTTAIALTEVPADVTDLLDPNSTAIGGVLVEGGRWRVLVMDTGPDGVRRPIMVELP